MFDYELPPELIAQKPCDPRDAARLMVIKRSKQTRMHQTFRDLAQLLSPGDCLVINDTKVMPARLYGKKADTGGKVEILLLEKLEQDVYRCLGQPGKRLQPGMSVELGEGVLMAEVLASERGEKTIRFSGQDVDATLRALGEMPLPPYIERTVGEDDTDWYQTVFAQEEGAVAAPTAGLHFTDQLLDKLQALGVVIAPVTLHVGWGTFKPVGEEELAEGKLHSERYWIPEATLQAMGKTQQAGGRVVAVGTTSVRTLESYALTGQAEGNTELFIQPGFEFKMVDAMITNFHLPGTSLLYLVSAFAGTELASKAYEHAVREQYRFYSYGDAMYIC